MITIDWSEKDIEDYLCKKIGNSRCTNINKIIGCNNFAIIGRQVKILDFYIDILAYDKYTKNFFIIELKKTKLIHMH